MISIDALGDRFIGMFKDNSEKGIVLRLEVYFKSKNLPELEWVLFGNETEEKDATIFVVRKSDSDYIYHVLGMEGVITFGDLIKHSKSIIDINMEIEEKKLLFKKKIDELSYFFQKYSVEELYELRFEIPDIKIVKAGSEDEVVKKKRGRKPKNTIVENTCIEYNNE